MQQLETLTELFKRFPGIGQRQAERFSRFVASAPAPYVQKLAHALVETNHIHKQCPECFLSHESDQAICNICATRPSETIIIVEKDADVAALEAATELVKSAHYFVLGGLLPIVKDRGETIRINALRQIIQKKQPKEILLALSVHPDADHTSRYISGYLQETCPTVTVSLLGRGLSNGSEIEYLDPSTLSEAFKGRVNL